MTIAPISAAVPSQPRAGGRASTVHPVNVTRPAVAEPWILGRVRTATTARDERAGQLTDEVVETARLLWHAVGAEKPAAVPPGFASLRPRHIQLLRLLGAQPGIAVRAAATALGMRPHNVSTLVTDLVRRGLIERRGDPDDRRVARLYLTERAAAELDEAEQDLHCAVVEAVSRLTDVDQGRIRAALPALHRLIASLTPDGATGSTEG